MNYKMPVTLFNDHWQHSGPSRLPCFLMLYAVGQNGNHLLISMDALCRVPHSALDTHAASFRNVLPRTEGTTARVRSR